jgi:hypothetical protein
LGQAGRVTRKRIQNAASLEPEIPAYRRYRLERTHELDCDQEIIDLLENATPEKLDKLDDTIVEDLNIVESIRNLLHTRYEGVDIGNEVDDVPDERIIRRIMMVLSGECLKICPTREESPVREVKKRRARSKSLSPVEEPAEEEVVVEEASLVVEGEGEEREDPEEEAVSSEEGGAYSYESYGEDEDEEEVEEE